MTYNVILAGFETKEQAEEFISWYGNQGEQDFGLYLDCQADTSFDFAPVDYHKTPTWFGDNYIAHVTIFHKQEDDADD